MTQPVASPVHRIEKRGWLGGTNLGVAVFAGIIANYSGALYAELEPRTEWGPWTYVVVAWVTSALALAWWTPATWRRIGLLAGALASAAWFAYMLRFEWPPNLFGHALATTSFTVAAIGGWNLRVNEQTPSRAARLAQVLALFAAAAGAVAAAIASTFILFEWWLRDRDGAEDWIYLAAAWGSLWLGIVAWKSGRRLDLLLGFAIMQGALAGVAAILFLDPSIWLHGAAALAAGAAVVLQVAWRRNVGTRA